MTTNTINIVITENGSRVVKRNLDDLGESASATADAVETLKSALEAIVAAEAVRAIVEVLNTYQQLQNRLRTVTTDQANLNAVWQSLIDVSTKTRTSLETNVESYQRLALSTKNLGLSQQDAISFMTRLAEAIKISGVGSQEAANGVRQLTQGLSAGRLQGQDLRAVLEDIPVVGQAIAKGMGLTIGQLRAAAQQGLVTSQQIVDAFNKVGPALDEQFAKTLPTIEDGWTLLKNQILATTGALSDTTDAGTTTVKVMLAMSNTLKQLTPGFVNVVHAMQGSLDPQDKMTSGFKVLATILTVVYSAFVTVSQYIKDVVVAQFEIAGNVIGGLAAAIVEALHGKFAEAGSTLKSTFGDAVHNTTTDVKHTFNDLVTNTSDAMTKIKQIWSEGARTIQDRRKDVVGTVSTKRSAPAALPTKTKVIEETKKQLASLLSQFDRVDGAELKLKEDEELLAKAQQLGIITKAQEAKYVQMLIDHYKDIIDPVGKYIRQLDDETKMLALDSDERQIALKIYQLEQTLKQEGITLTKKETDTIHEKLEAQQQLNKVMQQQDALLQGSQGKQNETFNNQLTAISNLLKNPASGFKKTDATNALSQQNPELFANTQAQFDAQAAKYQNMYSQIDALRQKDLISEQTAAAMRLKVWSQQSASQLQTSTEFFGDLAQLSKSSNTKIAAIGKAAAITQAMINTYQAATAAYASLASIPYVGPELGAAAAAAAIVAGLANVAQIRNQTTGFMTGGSFTVPGTGGSDSQMVAFRATPGERVSVATPAQVRKGDPSGGGSSGNAAPVQHNTRIINVLDPGMVGDYLATPNGETAVLNLMRRNSDQVQAIAKS